MSQNAEYDAGPEDGHTFRFRFDIRGSSKVVGDPEHTDGPEFMGPVHEFQVRAWNLRDALRKAADLPFSVLMGHLVSDEPLPSASPDSTPCDDEMWSQDYFKHQEVDGYWMACHRLGPHDEHENSETGATWPSLVTTRVFPPEKSAS